MKRIFIIGVLVIGIGISGFLNDYATIGTANTITNTGAYIQTKTGNYYFNGNYHDNQNVLVFANDRIDSCFAVGL